MGKAVDWQRARARAFAAKCVALACDRRPLHSVEVGSESASNGSQPCPAAAADQRDEQPTVA